MKNYVKRVAALCLCVISLVSVGCKREPLQGDAPLPTGTPVLIQSYSHQDVALSDMKYTRPDVELIAARLDDLLRGISIGKPVDEMIAEYNEILNLYNEADAMSSLAYLNYAFDVTNDYYQGEYAFLQSTLSELDLSMTQASIALFESSDEAEAAARTAFGSQYVDTVYEDENLNSEEIRALEDSDQALVSSYDRLLTSYTVLYNGKKWSYDDIVQDETLDYSAYLDLYDAYCKGFNQEAGSLFLKLVSLRDQISDKLGYGSYAAYRYDVYGRDYSVTDAQKLHAAVKKYIVPVYTARDQTENLMDLYGSVFDESTFLSALSDTTADFSPVVSEAARYMLRNHLYDFSTGVNKMSGSFTTYINTYRAPFMFSRWTGSYTDLTTILHELGHFTNYYHNPSAGWSAGDSLDLAEIDSQGLELLMTPYFDQYYGKVAQQAVSSLLSDCLYALISGCMEDEFQQLVYQTPTMTLDELNSLYERLEQEYGLASNFGSTGLEWVLIPHTFQTPMYYISYAVSMAAALELYEMTLNGNQSQAREIYLAILNRPPFAAFREELQKNGLSDVFDESTIQRLGEELSCS